MQVIGMYNQRQYRITITTMRFWMVNIIGKHILQSAHSTMCVINNDIIRKNRICPKKKSKNWVMGLFVSRMNYFFFLLHGVTVYLFVNMSSSTTHIERQIHHLPLVPSELSNDLAWSKTMFPWEWVRSKLDVILPKAWDTFHLSPHPTFFMNLGVAPPYLCDNMFTHLQCDDRPLKNHWISR